MGWTFHHFKKKPDIIKYLTERRTWVTLAGATEGHEALKKCVRGSTLYAVMRNFRIDSEGKETETGRFLTVCLLGSNNGDWGYKGMKESMGPTEAKCPPAYFKLVGPPPNDYAKYWRVKCEIHAAKMARKPVVGDWWSLPSCNPSLLKITSAKPLRGVNSWSAEVWGTGYRIPKRLLGERVWSPSWGTDTVRAMLLEIHGPTGNEKCPILADALQDAGCEDEKLLATLRGQNITEQNKLVWDMLQATGLTVTTRAVTVPC